MCSEEGVQEHSAVFSGICLASSDLAASMFLVVLSVCDWRSEEVTSNRVSNP